MLSKLFMEIIRPLDNKISEKVKNWRQIKKEAWELKELMDTKRFNGYWEDAYAISHVQVSRDPKAFFVVNKKVVKTFGSWCVVNAKILKQSDPCTFPEGCMSFMYRKTTRVERSGKVTVLYWTPFLNLFLIPRIKTFNGLKGQIEAFIVQHEADHARGINIYGL